MAEGVGDGGGGGGLMGELTNLQMDHFSDIFRDSTSENVGMFPH